MTYEDAHYREFTGFLQSFDAEIGPGHGALMVLLGDGSVTKVHTAPGERGASVAQRAQELIGRNVIVEVTLASIRSGSSTTTHRVASYVDDALSAQAPPFVRP